MGNFLSTDTNEILENQNKNANESNNENVNENQPNNNNSNESNNKNVNENNNETVNEDNNSNENNNETVNEGNNSNENNNETVNEGNNENVNNDNENEEYNIVKIDKLREKLGRIRFVNEEKYELLNKFNFLNLEKVKRNLNLYTKDKKGVNELLYNIIDEFNKNLIVNNLKEDWIKEPLGKEGLNYLLLKDYSIKNSKVIEKDLEVIREKKGLTEEELKINNKYECKFNLEIKNNLIYHKPLFKSVDYNNCYLGYEEGHFMMYGKFNETDIQKQNLYINLTLYELGKENGVYINYEDLSFDNNDNNYDYSLFSLLEDAIVSMNNNNNRQMASYVNRFKKKLSKVKNTDILCKMGDNVENKVILLKNFIDNLDV